MINACQIRREGKEDLAFALHVGKTNFRAETKVYILYMYVNGFTYWVNVVSFAHTVITIKLLK